METIEETTEVGFYVTRWAGCIPLFVMLVPTVVLSLSGVLSTGVMIASGVLGLMIGSLFARSRARYWDVVIHSLGDYTGLLLFPLLLVVGIYGEILSSSQLPEALIWLSRYVDAGPAVYALFVYVVCAVLGTAMGTSLGIVIIMTPVLYPVAVSLGVHPVIACGAILSGAATGDHLAPVSDTTIISSSTQRYRYREGSAGVGEVVRARMKYVLPAFGICCLLYLIAGGLTVQPALTNSNYFGDTPSPTDLIMLIPMLAVVIAAARGSGVLEALTLGSFASIVIALVFGLLEMPDLFSVTDGKAGGILLDGAQQNLDTAAMILLMMGAYGVMREYGLLEIIIGNLKSHVGRSARATELTLFGIGWLMNFLLVGLVARVTVVAGPIFDELGRATGIHPRRRANLLDGVANSFSFIVPWHVWPLLMIMTVTPLAETYPFLKIPAPTDFLMSTFYPLVIWCVMLIAVVTGYGREFEVDERDHQARGLITTDQ